MLKIKKLHPEAVLPVRANYGDAGLDLVAVSKEYASDWNYIEYDTGLAIQVPYGFVGLLFPRSSISKTSMRLANSVGVLDHGYTGPVKFRFKTDNIGSRYEVGDKVGQLVVVPLTIMTPVLVDDLGDTERGDGGFGSSDKGDSND